MSEFVALYHHTTVNHHFIMETWSFIFVFLGSQLLFSTTEEKVEIFRRSAPALMMMMMTEHTQEADALQSKAYKTGGDSIGPIKLFGRLKF